MRACCVAGPSARKKTLVAVTSPIHSRRARLTLALAARASGLDVAVDSCAAPPGPGSLWWLEERPLVQVANEALKLGLYRALLRARVDRSPAGTGRHAASTREVAGHLSTPGRVIMQPCRIASKMLGTRCGESSQVRIATCNRHPFERHPVCAPRPMTGTPPAAGLPREGNADDDPPPRNSNPRFFPQLCFSESAARPVGRRARRDRGHAERIARPGAGADQHADEGEHSPDPHAAAAGGGRRKRCRRAG